MENALVKDGGGVIMKTAALIKPVLMIISQVAGECGGRLVRKTFLR
jgi:hypothetical protein